jgi:hypothetical protein
MFHKIWSSSFSSRALLSLITLGAPVSIASAGLINAGFEDPIQSVDSWDYTASGWVTMGDAGVFRPTNAAYFNGAYAGQQVGFVQSGWVYSTGTLRQTTSDILLAGQTYEFATMVGRRLDNPLLPWQGYSLSLYAGAVLLVTANSPVDPGLGSWERASIQYTAEVGSLGIGDFLTVELTSYYGQTNFDDASFGLVPTPGTSALALAGSLLATRRRR